MIETGVDDPELILPHRATGYQTNWGLGTARYKYMPSSFSSGSEKEIRPLFLSSYV